MLEKVFNLITFRSVSSSCNELLDEATARQIVDENCSDDGNGIVSVWELTRIQKVCC